MAQSAKRSVLDRTGPGGKDHCQLPRDRLARNPDRPRDLLRRRNDRIHRARLIASRGSAMFTIAGVTAFALQP